MAFDHFRSLMLDDAVVTRFGTFLKDIFLNDV